MLPPRAVAWSLLATASALAAAALLLSRRKLITRAKQPVVIATYKTKVTDRRWYRQVVVTEHYRPASSLETLRSLHLGSPDNVRARKESDPSTACGWGLTDARSERPTAVL